MRSNSGNFIGALSSDLKVGVLKRHAAARVLCTTDAYPSGTGNEASKRAVDLAGTQLQDGPLSTNRRNQYESMNIDKQKNNQQPKIMSADSFASLADSTHLRGPRPNLLRQSASPGEGGSAWPAALLPAAGDIPAGEVDNLGRGARLRPEACDLGCGGVVGEGPGIEPLEVSLVGDGGFTDLWRLAGETAAAATTSPLGGLLTLYLSSRVRLGLPCRFVDP